ncbi:MAG TPA: hypothetical protein VN363_08045 [Anaerolineales bacterium]|nr:hypothetical protein [Anaerolineales bacterium]
MKSVQRIAILILVVALAGLTLPSPAAIVNAQVSSSTTVYLPAISSQHSEAHSPFSIQIAGLSQITNDAAFANLTSKEAEITRENLIAELDAAFPSMLAAFEESGAGYARVYIDWKSIETTRGVYNWSFYDMRLPALHAAGLGLIATVTNAPDWAINPALDPCAAIITEPQAYNQFLETMGNRFPFIDVWEILNEPDAIPGYRCGDGVMNYAYAGAQYASLLQGAYTTIKALNPTAKVILGGMAYDHFVDEDTAENRFYRYFLDDVINAGAAPYMDGVNFHYFKNYAAGWEGWTNGNGSPTCEGIINVDEGGDTFYHPWGFDITAKASHVSERLRVCHNVSKPLWLTEIGANGIGPNNSFYHYTQTPTEPFPHLYGATLEDQARYVFTIHARGFATGAENITWYAMKTIPDLTPIDFQGLLYDARDGSALDNSPKPAFAAYKTMTRELGSYRFDKWVAFDPATRPAAEAYQFQHLAGSAGGKPKLVAWSNSGSSVPLSLANSEIRVVSRPDNGIFQPQFTVSDGGFGDADGVANGTIQFELQAEPVIIELVR